MVTLNWTFNSKGDHLPIFNSVKLVPYFVYNQKTPKQMNFCRQNPKWNKKTDGTEHVIGSFKIIISLSASGLLNINLKSCVSCYIFIYEVFHGFASVRLSYREAIVSFPIIFFCRKNWSPLPLFLELTAWL